MGQPGTDPAAVPSAGHQRRPARFSRALHVVLWITTVQVALQPVFAGMNLDGVPNAGLLHLVNASVLELITTVAVLILAILAWRPGRAPGSVAVAGILVFVVIWVQAALGHAGALSVHVPLGVATLGLVVWLLLATRNVRAVPKDRGM